MHEELNAIQLLRRVGAGRGRGQTQVNEGGVAGERGDTGDASQTVELQLERSEGCYFAHGGKKLGDVAAAEFAVSKVECV